MISLLVAVVASKNLPQHHKETTCSCWTGYKPKVVPEMGYLCAGEVNLHYMPCNVLEPPQCVCSNGVTAILKDRSGTWCTTYRMGIEFRRWRCENSADWDAFFMKTEA